jgi:hypothetical protein
MHAPHEHATATAAGDVPLDDGRDRGETPVAIQTPDAVEELTAPERPRFRRPATDHQDGRLLPADEHAALRLRWEELQAEFAGDPRRTVEGTDELAGEVLRRVGRELAAERDRLEQRWARGEDVPAAELRASFARYRSLLRLLSA